MMRNLTHLVTNQNGTQNPHHSQCHLFQFVHHKADISLISYWITSKYNNFDHYKNLEKVDFDTMYPSVGQQKRYIYFYGPPGIQEKLFREGKVFPLTIWLYIIVVTVAHIAVFEVMRRVYIELQEDLVKKNSGPLDIAIKVLATITESDPMDIFPKWSSGQF